MITNLIDLFCTSEEKREGKTIYRGYAFHYLNFDRYLTNDFKPMLEAFNGYREVYYSKDNLCSVSTCEGDLTIILFNDINSFNNDVKEAELFYQDH